MQTIETIKNIFNILFFIAVASVGILSYLQARKTLFSPIRTEIFKLQLKNFEELLAFFQNKNEYELMKELDLDKILRLNSIQMADSYAKKFFSEEITIDEEIKKKNRSQLIGAVVPAEQMQKNFKKIDVSNRRPETKQETITNPAIILSSWHKYEHSITGYTQKYEEQTKEVLRLSASPLLPKKLRELLGKFNNIAHKNLIQIGETISKSAKQMPEHFPTAAAMSEFDTNWIWNDFSDIREPLEPVAKEILSYMESYLNIENLMK